MVQARADLTAANHTTPAMSAALAASIALAAIQSSWIQGTASKAAAAKESERRYRSLAAAMPPPPNREAWPMPPPCRHRGRCAPQPPLQPLSAAAKAAADEREDDWVVAWEVET